MSQPRFIPLAIDLSFLYGVFVAMGGALGYYQAGSIASLYGGIVAGLAATLASYMCRRGNVNLGLKLLCGTAIGLVFLFHKRYQATRTFLPSGFMAFNSAAIVAISVLALKELNSLAVGASTTNTNKKSS
jgi:uncharacterized membrane protein (UPF0136 family)